MLHKMAAIAQQHLRRLLTKLATIAAFAVVMATIAYCSTAYICNQIESANRSAEHTTRIEIEKAVDKIINNSDRNFANLMASVARQSEEKSDLSVSDIAEEMKAIHAEIDSIKSSITVELYPISQRLGEIEKQTKFITKNPSSLSLSPMENTLDEKMDSIQMGIDAINRKIIIYQ